jgi:hypothetical protein
LVGGLLIIFETKQTLGYFLYILRNKGPGDFFGVLLRILRRASSSGNRKFKGWSQFLLGTAGKIFV